MNSLKHMVFRTVVSSVRIRVVSWIAARHSLTSAAPITTSPSPQAPTHHPKMVPWRSTTASLAHESAHCSTVRAFPLRIGPTLSDTRCTSITDLSTRTPNVPLLSATLATNPTAPASESLDLVFALRGQARDAPNLTTTISLEYFLATRQPIKTFDTSTSTRVLSRQATMRLSTRPGISNLPVPPLLNSCTTWDSNMTMIQMGTGCYLRIAQPMTLHPSLLHQCGSTTLRTHLPRCLLRTT